MKVAVLGLGLMGTAMAQRLRACGHTLFGWNRSQMKVGTLSKDGIHLTPSAADAVEQADFIVLLLSDAAAIETVLYEPSVCARLGGKMVLQMATIAPEESRRIGQRLQQLGARYMECPVLGSLPEVKAGKLILMPAGQPLDFERSLPLLQELGPLPRLVGALGQGAAMKLAMNQLIASLTAGFAFSLGLVRAEGVEVEQFMELLRESTLYAGTFEKKLDKYLSHNYRNPNFPLKHLLKDVRLCLEAGDTAAVDTSVLVCLEAICCKAVAAGFAEDDYSVLYEVINPQA